jgi:hypothetical protein
VVKYGYLCRGHIIPELGARKLARLSADDVDRWLQAKAKVLSTSTLQRISECLERAIDRPMAPDKAKRNVVKLCGVPAGQPGRPSKSLTLPQAMAVAMDRIFAVDAVAKEDGIDAQIDGQHD